jgi:hypothetical protein
VIRNVSDLSAAQNHPTTCTAGIGRGTYTVATRALWVLRRRRVARVIIGSLAGKRATTDTSGGRCPEAFMTRPGPAPVVERVQGRR